MEQTRRVPTGVEGLDSILHGGLFAGGVYMFEGAPGVGKTTLANQIAYLRARAGDNTLYATLLAESHARMLQHMQGQAFFDPSAVNASVFYLSTYRELEQGGLKAVIDVLRGEVSRHQASLLIIDGFVIEATGEHSGDGVRQFIHELQSLASSMDCVCLLLTGSKGALNPEQTMVDGIFVLEDHDHQWRTERRLQVRKFRGSAVERGQHTFCITNEGLQIFPRLEGQTPRPAIPEPGPLLCWGVRGLDESFSAGGLRPGSNTLVWGASGSGKTTFALAFALEAARGQAPGRSLFCVDVDASIRECGEASGLPAAQGMDQGGLTVCGPLREDESLDQIGHKILRLVDERSATRLVVDGLGQLAETLAFAERGYRFVARLLHELRARNVTSVFTADPPALAAAAGPPLADAFVGLFDNALEMSYDGEHGSGFGLVIRKARAARVRQAKFGLVLNDFGLHATPRR